MEETRVLIGCWMSEEVVCQMNNWASSIAYWKVENESWTYDLQEIESDSMFSSVVNKMDGYLTQI